MGRLAAVLATLGSAALFGLSFPTASLRGLAWVALVPFLLAVRGRSLAGALGLGWLWALAAAYGVGDWFPGTVSRYYDQPAPIGIALFFASASLMAAPEYMAFAAYYRALARRPGPMLPLLAGAGWTAAELGRGWLLTGNPLALVGYSQVGVEPLQQIADVAGVYGLSFLVAAVNAAVAELCVVRRRPALAGVALAGALVAAAAAYGALRARAIARLSERPAVKVALVQGNCDLGSLWQEDFFGRNLDVYLRLTAEALRGDPALVVWPESAMSFFLESQPRYARQVRELLADGKAELLAGGPRRGSGDEPRFFNTMYHLSPAGQVLGSYDKQHLVPLGEHFPLGGIEFLRRRFARVREFTPGRPDGGILPTTAGALGVGVCNEAMFPEVMGARVRAGAEVLVNPANDTWLEPKFSDQLFDMVRLRAIEQRRWLIRVSTSGPSAVIDPLGRVVVKTEPFTEAVAFADVRPADTPTIYGRAGDAFAFACTAFALGAWLRRGRAGAA